MSSSSSTAASAVDAALDESRPTFLRLLLDDHVKTVMICGTGGGYDFMHSGLFIPMLLASKKNVLFHSYSFGDTRLLRGSTPYTPGDVPPPGSSSSSSPSSPPPPYDEDEAWPDVRIVDGDTQASSTYGPEVALCKFLDLRYPGGMSGVRRPKKKDRMNRKTDAFGEGKSMRQQHLEQELQRQQQQEQQFDEAREDDGEQGDGRWWLYASYARDWTAKSLRNFYESACRTHDVDAVLAIDGGSDSLMRGTEGGLGDPIEDACTIASLATMMVPPGVAPVRVLVSVGFGCDRFNGVTDDSSMRAIAELTSMSRPALDGIETSAVIGGGGGGGRRRRHDGNVGSSVGGGNSLHDGDNNSKLEQDQPMISGFLGTHAAERFSAGATFYSDLIEFAQRRSTFRSVIANSIVETSRGSYYGSDAVPESLRGRVRPGELHLWPFMSIAFAFDIRLVYERSDMCPLLLECKSIPQMYKVIHMLISNKNEGNAPCYWNANPSPKCTR